MCCVTQAEAYSAMIDPVVEALCYLTPMGFDVLGFVIIDRLTSTGRAKIKVGDLCLFVEGLCFSLSEDSVCRWVMCMFSSVLSNPHGV